MLVESFFSRQRITSAKLDSYAESDKDLTAEDMMVDRSINYYNNNDDFQICFDDEPEDKNN